MWKFQLMSVKNNYHDVKQLTVKMISSSFNQKLIHGSQSVIYHEECVIDTLRATFFYIKVTFQSLNNPRSIIRWLGVQTLIMDQNNVN